MPRLKAPLQPTTFSARPARDPIEKRSGPIALPRDLPRTFWLVLIAIAACLAYPRHSWNTYRNANESARLYLVEAIIDRHELAIDDAIQVHGDLLDKAVADGHFYCDKPIGLSLWAAPVRALLRALGCGGIVPWSLPQWRYALTLLCVSLPSVMILPWLYSYWRETSGNPDMALFGVFAYGIGTLALPYGTQFMGHQFAVVPIIGHWALARRARSDRRAAILAAAGLCAGFGAISDYASALVHAAIALRLLWETHPKKPLALYLAGCLTGIAPLLIYNTICFGGPFSMAYGHEAFGGFQAQHEKGVFGLSWPTIDAALGLLFSPGKGLFFLCPLLALGIVGLAAELRHDLLRSEALLASASTLAVALFGICVVEWRAGLTVGPRHMTPMLPFLMSGVVWLGARRPALKPMIVAAGLAGVAIMSTSTLTIPAYEAQLASPLRDQVGYLLEQGLVSRNAGMDIGLRGIWSLIPIGLVILLTAVVACGPLLREMTSGRPVWAIAAGLAILPWPWIAARIGENTAPVLAFSRGVLLRNLDRPREAAEQFERALDLMPTAEMADRAGPHLARAYLELRDFPAITNLTVRWRSLSPESPVARDLAHQLIRDDYSPTATSPALD